MKFIIGFIKQNLILILSAVVGGGGIALGVFGYLGMSAVTDNMAEAESLIRDLKPYERGESGTDPINKKAIDIQKAKKDAILAYYDQVLEKARDLNRHTPLRDDVFPRRKNIEAGQSFISDYQRAVQGLLTGLDATTEPTDGEIKEMGAQIKSEEMRRQDAETLGLTDSERSSDRRRGGAAQPPVTTDPEERARSDPKVRAAIFKARSHRCYADADTSLQVNTTVADADMVPPEEDMWEAQMSLWVQQDLLGAVKRVNDEAAQALPEGEKPWVGNMPVKNIVSIRVSDYVMSDSEEVSGTGKKSKGSGARGVFYPPGAPSAVFTDECCNDLFEVVQVAIELVVDQRDLPTIFDAFSADMFYVVTQVSYDTAKPNPNLTGKIYGSEPCVRASILLDGYFLGELHRSLMPAAVRERLGLPELEEEYEDDYR